MCKPDDTERLKKGMADAIDALDTSDFLPYSAIKRDKDILIMLIEEDPR